MAYKTDAFKVVGLNEQLKNLDKIMTSDPTMEKAIQNIIREGLKVARRHLAVEAQSGLRMKSDPRHAAQAIKTTVYRLILGGNISILQQRGNAQRGQENPSSAPRKVRGGNRIKRSGRTIDLQSYVGRSRGFVLRFLNQGTGQRAIKHQETIQKAGGGIRSRWVSRPKEYGNRGKIAPRNWFGRASLDELKDIADVISANINDLIEERFNE